MNRRKQASTPRILSQFSDRVEVIIAGLAYLALIAGAGGYLLYFVLLDRIGPIEVNLIGYTAPMFAALGGWIFLGEGIALRTMLGFLVIITGFVLLKREAIRTELRETSRGH